MLATANTENIGRGFGKNAGEWTGRVEISKRERECHCSMYERGSELERRRGEIAYCEGGGVGKETEGGREM